MQSAIIKNFDVSTRLNDPARFQSFVELMHYIKHTLMLYGT